MPWSWFLRLLPSPSVLIRESFPPPTRCQPSVATESPTNAAPWLARAHGVNANQVFYWRMLYRKGRLGAATLLPVRVTSESLSIQAPSLPESAGGTWVSLARSARASSITKRPCRAPVCSNPTQQQNSSSHSPNHRFVIALHSPDGDLQTGLPVSLPERAAAELAF
jgi:hypothetical protein